MRILSLASRDRGIQLDTKFFLLILTIQLCDVFSPTLPTTYVLDEVIAALGKAEYVRGEWLKPGCVVIDVGINAVTWPWILTIWLQKLIVSAVDS